MQPFWVSYPFVQERGAKNSPGIFFSDDNNDSCSVCESPSRFDFVLLNQIKIVLETFFRVLRQSKEKDDKLDVRATNVILNMVFLYIFLNLRKKKSLSLEAKEYTITSELLLTNDEFFQESLDTENYSECQGYAQINPKFKTIMEKVNEVICIIIQLHLTNPLDPRKFIPQEMVFKQENWFNRLHLSDPRVQEFKFCHYQHKSNPEDCYLKFFFFKNRIYDYDTRQSIGQDFDQSSDS